MKKFKILSILLIAIIVINPACDVKKSNLPHSKGGTMELLVVTNNKEQWNSKIGTTIKDFFEAEFPGLPNFEPILKIFYVPQEAFIDLYKPNHMIFIVDIDKKFNKPVIETKSNLWARPQRVIKISAKDTEDFVKIFNEKKSGMMELFQKITRERILAYFKSAESRKSKSLFQKSLSLNLIIPSGYIIAKHQENQFIWLKKEKKNASVGLMAYVIKYESEDAFKKEKIIKRRNAYTKLHIPGPTKGSYMKVYEEGIDVISKEINFNGMYAVETRGMWDVKGDFMAGTFINYTFVDERNNRLITIDGYVYAPNREKRIHMKELEALIHSVSLYEAPEN